MINENCLHLATSPYFQVNSKTITAVTGTALVAATLIALGVLGFLKVVPTLHSSSIPLMACGVSVLALDIAWIIALCIKKTPPAEPLILQDFKIKIQPGSGFPFVDPETRQKVIDQTSQKIQNSDLAKEYSAYYEHIKYTQIPKNKFSKSFFPEGDVLQTPVLMEYDEGFQPQQGRNYFYMHSTAAPKRRDFDTDDDYLDAMENAYFNLLEQQIESGAEHLLTNYWGMGAFLRGYYSDQAVMRAFRLSITRRLANAYRRIVDKYSAHRSFTFYVGGPTGKSFPETMKHMRAEPEDNYHAWKTAFEELPSQYKEKLVFCPETDIFIKAQQLSDQYNLKRGELAPVSAINASDPDKLGNHWYEGKTPGKKFNAQFAIEENVFRRSSFLGFIAKIINEKSSCKEGVDSTILKRQ